MNKNKLFSPEYLWAVTTIRSVDGVTNEWCRWIKCLCILYQCSQTMSSNVASVALVGLAIWIYVDIRFSLNRKWNGIPIYYQLHFWHCYWIDARAFGPYFINRVHCFGCARKKKERNTIIAYNMWTEWREYDDFFGNRIEIVICVQLK